MNDEFYQVIQKINETNRWLTPEQTQKAWQFHKSEPVVQDKNCRIYLLVGFIKGMLVGTKYE